MWEDTYSVWFILKCRSIRGCLREQLGGVSKMEHFVECNKTYDASDATKMQFKKIIGLHGVQKPYYLIIRASL